MTEIEFLRRGGAFVREGAEVFVEADDALMEAFREEVSKRAVKMKGNLRITEEPERRWGACMCCGDEFESHRGGMCMLCVAALKRARKM